MNILIVKENMSERYIKRTGPSELGWGFRDNKCDVWIGTCLNQ